MPTTETANAAHEPAARHDRPTHAPEDDLGRRALRELHGLLAIDAARTAWHADGFTWRAHRLAQRFRLEGPVTIDGVPTWWVGVETDCLRGADLASERALAWIGAQNAAHRLGALVLEGDRVRLRARVVVRENSLPERVRLLAEWATVASTFAHGQAQALEEGLAAALGLPGLELDDGDEPPGGDGDELRDALVGIVARAAGAIEPDRVEELGGVVMVGLTHGAWVSSDRKAGWVRVRFAWGLQGLRETPFGGVVFREFADGPPVVELWALGGVRHPLLGAGTLVTLAVPAPEGVSAVEGARWANAWNLAELGAPLAMSSLGAWTWRPAAAGLGDAWEWGAFFPDATAYPKLPGLEVKEAIARAHWFVGGPGRGLRPGGGGGHEPNVAP
jgi:hypothetical protein